MPSYSMATYPESIFRHAPRNYLKRDEIKPFKISIIVQ